MCYPPMLLQLAAALDPNYAYPMTLTAPLKTTLV